MARQLMTTTELEQRYPQIPKETWRHWRYKGTGPRFARIGRRVVYDEADVEAWIEKQFADGPPRVAP